MPPLGDVVLGLNITRGLSDKLYDKRKAAALDVEK